MHGFSSRNDTKKLVLVNLLVIVCATVAVVHLPVLTARALSFDDAMYITENGLIQNPSWNSAWSFLTEVLEPSTVRGYYQPLTMLSLMTDCALAGKADDPRPFHCTSLLLHVANTALLTVLLYLLFDQCWVAGILGLFFGLHPITVEPVVWIAERKTLLAAFFSFLCLILYVRFARKGSRRLYVLCFGTYILALMSKPTALPLPVLMLLMDHWPLGRWKRSMVTEKILFFSFGGLFAIITYVSQARTALTVIPTEQGLSSVLLVLCHNVVFYLHKIVSPLSLSAYYAFPDQILLSNPMFTVGVVGTSVLALLLVVSLRWTRAAVGGLSFFFVAMLPVLGIVRFTNTIAADRHVYLPLVGLVVSLAPFMIWVGRSGPARHVWMRIALGAVVLTVAGGEAFLTRRYLSTWQNTIGHYRHMLSLCPSAPELHVGLGNAFSSRGRWDEAVACFRYSVQLLPHDASVHNNLGHALYQRGELAAAVTCYRQAIQIDPNLTKARENMAVALIREGRSGEASRQLDAIALHSKHMSIASLRKIAWIRATHADPKLRDPEQAVQLATDLVLATRRKNASALDTLAAAYAAVGHFDRAVKLAEEALTRAPITDGLANKIRDRLELYERNRPYQEGSTDHKALSGQSLFENSRELGGDKTLGLWTTTIGDEAVMKEHDMDPRKPRSHTNVNAGYRAKKGGDSMLRCKPP